MLAACSAETCCERLEITSPVHVGIHAAMQVDRGILLDLLLNPGDGWPTGKYELSAAALQMRNPKSGVTLLGQAVAWGYDEAIPPILTAVR